MPTFQLDAYWIQSLHRKDKFRATIYLSILLVFQVGNFDPVTREPLKEDQLVPNLAIKEAVQAYLKEHSWAYRLNC